MRTVVSMRANITSRISGDPVAQSRCKKLCAENTKIYEQILEEDHSRAKRFRMDDDEWIDEPAIVLGYPRMKYITVASLGPALKRRFVHPGGI